MRICIADSGTTKTDWCLLNEGKILKRFSTQGINPVLQSVAQIEAQLKQEVVPALKESVVDSFLFYGAGCNATYSPMVQEAIQHTFTSAKCIEVASDMLGAARALCGDTAGIVCILGTGSNSCYYNGKEIVQNTPPLGYILGDEGSGASLGKRLVGDCLKQLLPETLCRGFLEDHHLTQSDIIERVYRQPMANRFLASLSPFLYKHREETSVHSILTESFEAFISRNLMHYPHCDLNCAGSVAYYYAEELKEVATAKGMHIASILQRPMEGLINYHIQKSKS